MTLNGANGEDADGLVKETLFQTKVFLAQVGAGRGGSNRGNTRGTGCWLHRG